MIITESGNEKYMTQVSNGLANIIADTAHAGDSGEEYFRPHDLLCAAFASCLNITIRMVLERMNLNYEKVIVKVNVNRDQENSTVFLYQAEIIGDIEDSTKEAVISKALNCPVRKTLSKNISFQPMSQETT